jgi:hypothetical protein
MEKIYRGRFWKDNLWMGMGLVGVGILLVVLPLLAIFPMAYSAYQDGTLDSLLYIWVPFYAFFLAGSGACLYVVIGSMREHLRIADGALHYSGPFSSKRIAAMSIDKIMLFSGEKPIVIYEWGGDMKRFRLPRWENAYYMDDLVVDLKRMNPGVEVVDMRKGQAESKQQP